MNKNIVVKASRDYHLEQKKLLLNAATEIRQLLVERTILLQQINYLRLEAGEVQSQAMNFDGEAYRDKIRASIFMVDNESMTNCNATGENCPTAT